MGMLLKREQERKIAADVETALMLQPIQKLVCGLPDLVSQLANRLDVEPEVQELTHQGVIRVALEQHEHPGVRG